MQEILRGVSFLQKNTKTAALLGSRLCVLDNRENYCFNNSTIVVSSVSSKPDIFFNVAIVVSFPAAQ